jgi:hypothetical protein
MIERGGREIQYTGMKILGLKVFYKDILRTSIGSNVKE